MSGATWNDRQPSDWLASNGRWYPASQYPRGWDFLALPPAPGHGFAHRFSETDSDLVTATSGYDPPARHTANFEQRQAQTPPQPPPRPAPPRPQSSSTAVAPTGRSVADATVTKVSNYKRRIQPGQRPSGSLPPPPGQPPPPSAPPANRPAPPGRVSQQGSPRASVKSSAVTDLSNALQTGDLGGVLDKARRKIEDAINEAAEKK